MKCLNSQSNLPRLLKKLVLYSMLIVCFILVVSPSYGNDQQVVTRLTEAGEEELLMFFDPDDIMITTGAGRPLSKKKMPATVTVITAEELKQVAQEIMVGDKLRLAVVGPVANDAPLEKLLKL